MNRLFDKIPEELFSPLSRKYKSVYAFALVSLYHMLKMYKTDIRKADYVALLRGQGQEMMTLFSIETDRLDDKDDEEMIEAEKTESTEDVGALLGAKVNYIVRKLAKCGWYIISRDPKSNIEYIYIPAYSIQLLKLINELTSDTGSYLPLVHQTYAELKMEDEKEDDYMFRSLMNAKQNADTLEMSVTLLRQQICVFGNKLTHVLDPNQALKQHFDGYRVDISEKYYHPMKTFDSLGLYAQPTIRILNRWIKSERIISLLVKEAKTEPLYQGKEESELVGFIIRRIQDIIDIFSRLSSAFNEIDKANADYTEAVQKKVNYLSSSDRTVKGKVDKIILSLATEIKNNPALRYEELPLLGRANETLGLYCQGYLDSFSLTMPFRRKQIFASDPLPLDDDLFPDEAADMMNSIIDSELNRFSDSAISEYIDQNMGEKDRMLSNEMQVLNTDQLVLLILGILKAVLGLIPYRAQKLEDRIEYAGYYMPLYEFTRKKGAR